MKCVRNNRRRHAQTNNGNEGNKQRKRAPQPDGNNQNWAVERSCISMQPNNWAALLSVGRRSLQEVESNGNKQQKQMVESN
jgi:hypothetical protein